MFNLGFSEMVIIGILALILIGPKQLPEMARTVGRFLNDIKRSTDSLKDEFNAELHRVEDQITIDTMKESDKKQAEHLLKDKKNDSV
jgi:sec-independent protein translocase protein TatB